MMDPGSSNDLTWALRSDSEKQFAGIIHEIGFLDGYAATAADVATNPGLATPYGFRGSLLPVTDAPVS
jgi:hypothetical protein